MSSEIENLRANIGSLTNAIPKSVEIIAVSKRQSEDRINAALNMGWRVFGENRLQEAESRWGQRRALYPDLKLHFIGQFQSKKATKIVNLFDAIHSLDKLSSLEATAKAVKQTGRKVQLFIQVNTGEERQKGGIHPQLLPNLLADADRLDISISGLMVLPPINDATGPHFALIQKLSQRHGLPCLSMGMSKDFQTALLFGTTHIRVGTTFFGARPAS